MAESTDRHSPEEQRHLAEAEKLKKESLPPKWVFRCAPLVGALAGLAVVGTLLYSLWTFREQRIARQEERFRLATEALGSAEPAMRIVGANKLLRFLDKRRYREDVISLLAQLFLFERDEDVVHALAAGLTAAGRKYPDTLLRDTGSLKERALSKIIHTFSKKGKILQTIQLLQDKLYLVAYIERNSSKKSLTLPQGNFQCWRKLNADFKKSDLTDSIFWRADLYKADFSGANLQGALFMKADLSYANFRGANLQDVNFRGAKLFNARFEDVRNLALDMFKDTSWAWAHFDPVIKERLSDRFGKNEGREDLRREGREECNAYQK